MTDGIPESDDRSVHVGCKEDKNVPRFYNRSAGVMAIVRPCGIIIDTHELLTCESPSQLFTQLLRLRCEKLVDFSFVGYDRACEFHPFLKNLAAKGNEGASILLQETSYLVDRFHIKGHVNPKCRMDSDKCEYHPDLDKFKDVATTNTECAEQCFSQLGRFKHMMKYMSQHKFLFFLSQVVISHNVAVENRLRGKTA